MFTRNHCCVVRFSDSVLSFELLQEVYKCVFFGQVQVGLGSGRDPRLILAFRMCLPNGVNTIFFAVTMYTANIDSPTAPTRCSNMKSQLVNSEGVPSAIEIPTQSDHLVALGVLASSFVLWGMNLEYLLCKCINQRSPNDDLFQKQFTECLGDAALCSSRSSEAPCRLAECVDSRLQAVKSAGL